MKAWQVQVAKNKFSEVIEQSIAEGPQLITKHGRNAVVVMSYADYQKHVRPKPNIKDVLLNSGLQEDIANRPKTPNSRNNPFLAKDYWGE